MHNWCTLYINVRLQWICRCPGPERRVSSSEQSDVGLISYRHLRLEPLNASRILDSIAAKMALNLEKFMYPLLWVSEYVLETVCRFLLSVYLHSNCHVMILLSSEIILTYMLQGKRSRIA